MLHTFSLSSPLRDRALKPSAFFTGTQTIYHDPDSFSFMRIREYRFLAKTTLFCYNAKIFISKSAIGLSSLTEQSQFLY